MSKNKARRTNRDRDPYEAREAKKYENPIPSREFILGLMEDHGAPLRFDDMAEALKLEDPQQLDALSRRVKAMTAHPWAGYRASGWIRFSASGRGWR